MENEKLKQLIKDIRDCAERSDQDKTLSPAARESLRKEIVELINVLKHYTTEDVDETIKDIIKCAKKSDVSGLSSAIRTRLEKEFFELVNLLKHYTTLRWTVTSFFMTLSFGISSYFLSEGIKAHNYTLFVCSFGGPLIFITAVALFFFHNTLTDSMQRYLEVLGKILGYHSPEFLKKPNVKKKSLIVFFILAIIFVLVLLLLSYLLRPS